MKKIFSILAFCALHLLILFSQSCSSDIIPTDPQNLAPQVQSLSANPPTSSSSRLPAGGIVTLITTATDPERDYLSYTWECSGGSFIAGQNTNSVKWQAPVTQNQASYSVAVNVCDGELISSKYENIYVEKAIPGIMATPSNLNFGNDLSLLEIKVFNTGIGVLNWQIQDLASWISVSPSSGIIRNNSDTALIVININRASIAIGNYNKVINVINSSDPNNKIPISISMTISQTQSYGYLEGYVYFQNTSIPISDAIVNIENVNSTSNKYGYYRLDNIPRGNNKSLTAYKTDFDSYQSIVNINQGKNTKNLYMTSVLYTQSLQGTIISASTQQGIENMSVTLLNEDGSSTQLSANTDINGHYQISSIPKGNRKIKIYKENYPTSFVELQIGDINMEYNMQIYELGIPCPGIPTIIDSRDNKIYETVLIGNQCWLRKNMDIGIRISGNLNQTDNSTIEKYCYDNVPSNCTTYGGLYQWGEAMQYSTNEGAQGICPDGWHIPTLSEFYVLTMSLNYDAYALRIGGSSGFSALLAGLRNTNYSFSGLSEFDGYTAFWRSTEHDTATAYFLVLARSWTTYETRTYYVDKSIGISVRCLLDQ